MTIREIARIANISPSTVSKALNNRHDVSDNTRKKIFDIVDKYDYKPNPYKKAPKQTANENIGILFCREDHPLSDNPFYSRILEGIEAELAINNYNLVLNLINRKQFTDLPKMIREKHVDGIIIIGVLDKGFIKKLNEIDTPIVFADPQIELKERSQVIIDNEHGGFMATQYLINKGHRKIGFISPSLDRLSFQQRFEGYLKALKFYHIPINKNLIRTGGLENGYLQINMMLKKDRPTAIFATNDLNAINGYKAIYENKLKIPNDVSVIGFDDIAMSKFSVPSLTTIRVYKEELGSIAVRTLLKTINGEITSPVTTIVPTKLIERESVKK